jgi:hypothetical protein
MKNIEAERLNLKLELVSSFIADLIAMLGNDIVEPQDCSVGCCV